MHLVPAERAHQPSIDDHRVCEAIEALGDPEHLATWADRFSLLSDPHRLAMLLCISQAGPISVTDLALATGMNATAVSQALRLLRAAGVVTGTRDGRVIRYQLADETLLPLITMATPTRAGAAARGGKR
ncbi:metalloregulator ArsR/SmtB family transcription factor [Streptomyces sp. RB6PN25]|uniref:Metalloregulator ArsR/SmtB family transcription factor n=1 Tax=Streptomyces humicola TaxID=2953240 RepID=A0ABT1Q0N3_9ACTN|nr:metalloregulator ArsR/SmtB family transcription factor [Streptomyces humicola]MCQ4083478.1 metalloregulator ArsR/SmtB family transcription factor [Streptomyces humicola]